LRLKSDFLTAENAEIAKPETWGSSRGAIMDGEGNPQRKRKDYLGPLLFAIFAVKV
jgi:hypothetical protein